MTPHPTPMPAMPTISRKTPPRRLTAGWGCNPRLVEPLYFGLDAASARIARAASSVMSFPLSRLWIVIRETPSRAATCVGVPMDSRIALYSLGLISGFGGDLPQIAVSCFDGCGKLTAEDKSISGLLVSLEELHGPAVESCFADVFDSVLCGVHLDWWFGVGRSHWRRGERKTILPSRQELSVKSFYAPFLRHNAESIRAEIKS